MTTASDDFYARVKGFLKANGAGYVIHARPDPTEQERQQRSADLWFAYLAIKGLQPTASTWRSILTGQGKAITVPCEDPELFDLAYCNPAIIPSWNPQTTQRSRGNPAQVVERAKQKMRAYTPKREKWEPVPEPIVSPQEWLDQQEANPQPVPMLSDEARSRLVKRFDSAA